MTIKFLKVIKLIEDDQTTNINIEYKTFCRDACNEKATL